MDEALAKSGEWPNVALIPGTHTHAATGEHVEQPENTRIGRSRGACRLDNADCEPEPAAVENGAQNGLECDTREKLEADIRKSLVFGFADIFGWLDRQAAISEREYWENCCQNHVDYDEEYKPAIDALTAELQDEGQNLNALSDENLALKDRIAELESTCNTLRASVAGLKQTVDTQHRAINGLTDDVAEKRLRIAKLQRENARLRGECD